MEKPKEIVKIQNRKPRMPNVPCFLDFLEKGGNKDMKKICMILFIGVFLALMLSLPGIAEEEQKQKVKFTIHVGGLVTTFSQGYEFSFDIENATWTEFVPNMGEKFGLDVGVGIFPISQLELYASYSSYNGTALGVYNLRLPHIWDDEIVSNTMRDVENDFRASVFSFGLAFHPIIAGKFKPYFGVGLSNVNVKIDFPDSVSINEDVLAEFYWDYYPPYYWEEVNHTIDIIKVGFTEESKSVWGIHAKAGANVEVIRDICIFAEARYLSATAKFDRPDATYKVKSTLDYYEYVYGYEWEDTYTLTGEETVDIDDTVKIKVGGIQGIIGIKLSF